MKKLLLIIIIAICLSLVGCGNTTTDNDEMDIARFIVIEAERANFETYYAVLADRDTKVMYLFCKAGYGGGLTVMLDADGKPLIWDGDEK